LEGKGDMKPTITEMKDFLAGALMEELLANGPQSSNAQFYNRLEAALEDSPESAWARWHVSQLMSAAEIDRIVVQLGMARKVKMSNI
jgi:hypothetical protein